MNPDNGRAERNRYAVFILTLSYSAFALALIIENIVVGWESWAIPFLLLSIGYAWWLHLKQPFSDQGRVYALAALYYGITFYQGVHESSLFDISLIICFVFLLFSLTDDLRVYSVGLVVYFVTLAYQLVTHYGLAVFSDPLTLSRILLHMAIVIVSARFSRSTIGGRQRSNEMQGRVIGQLSEIHRRTEDFMSNVSHELRTPINAVTGLSSIIIEREGKASEEMDSIYRAGQRLSEQVGDILDYTEIDTGRLVLSQDIYGIYSVVNDVVSMFRVQYLDSAIDLVIDVEAAVPAKLKGDVRRLKKILFHLIDNAYKFTKLGGIYVHIDADKRPYGINLRIEVSDTGCGIRPDELQKISRGFYQADSGRTRSAGGMGLGLSIVYGFVHAMGGFVNIVSSPGQGTTVHLTIPQVVMDPAPCMSVKSAEKLVIACYLNAEKYEIPLVRDYYEAMITHLVRGLKVTIRRASTLDDLKKTVDEAVPTHIFTSQDEYEEDPAWFTRLARSTEVIIVAGQKFTLEPGNRITVLRKPFYGFPIASILNALNVNSEIDPIQADYSISFPNLRVLVVDDEEMNLFVANGIFSGYGMRVHTAASGKEALSVYDREPFDLVFMDHMMPEMDGIEAMKLLSQASRTKNYRTFFVALTANAVSGAKEMFLAEGFDGFLSKPINTKEMEHILLGILPPDKVLMKKGGRTEHASPIRKAEEGESLGINRCLGDSAFYGRLRRIFIDEMAHNMRVFKSAYATGTIEPYRVRLRALRDGSRILGEEALSRQARRLELAFADGDNKRIQKEHLELCSQYEECVERLKKRAMEEGDEE